MAIEKSNRYSTDTQGNVQSSTPLVVIYKGVRSDNIDEIDTIPDSDKLFISTSNIYFDGQYYKPILSKAPSIKQTVDDENKKFRIQTTNIEINNTEFHGVRFTDELQLITNCAIRIYYKTQSCKSLDDCILLAQTTIKEFRQRNNRISVITEDSTQALLSKTIPALAEGIEYALNDQNKPIPIVYGHVNKSPVIKKIDPFTTDTENNATITSLICDSKEITQIQSEIDYTEYPTPISQYMQVLSPIYIYDEGYLNIVNTIPNDILSDLDGNFDTTIPFFEKSGNELVVTNEYNKFVDSLQTSENYQYLELTTAIMGRIHRNFTDISGSKTSRRTSMNWGDDDNRYETYGGRLFATTIYKENDIFEPDSYRKSPMTWFFAMFDENNYQVQSEACFPFEQDNYDVWSITDYPFLGNQGLDEASYGHYTTSHLLKNWNVPNSDGTQSIFNLKPNNYLNYINENDERALCWAGAGLSFGGNSGDIPVNWEFKLDDLGFDHKCRTYVFMDMYHYRDPDKTYGEESNNHPDYISGSALWSDAVDTPVLNPLHITSFPTELEDLDISAQNTWKYWNTVAPTGETYNSYSNIVQKLHDFEPVVEWLSTSQLKSIKVGQPLYTHGYEHRDNDQRSTGALNYLHFIQDVFIENPDSKDWYVNVLGRKTDEIVWSPFNSWELQTIPYYEDNADAFEYIKSLGYSTNFGSDEDTSGGQLGWIVNTGFEFNLQEYISQFSIIPKKIWFLNTNNDISVFEDGQWSVDKLISIGETFIILSDLPIRINPFSSFIRMNHIISTNNDWEQGFTPDEALQQVNDNYIANGWKNYLYTPEIGIGGAVEKPNQVIQHLITSETTYSSDNFTETDTHKAFATHQGWRMAFTINEQKEVKDVIQELSTNTKLLPRFSADGTFDFTTLKTYYNANDVDYKITKSDAISWSFELSKLENVNNQYKIKFEYDYATEKYNEIVPDFIYTRTEKAYNDYKDITKFLYDEMTTTPDNFIYDIKQLYNKETDESVKEFEAKYIRHRYTAEQLRKHLLMDNINEHLIINLTLNNKYTDIEIGDVLYIDQLSDELGLGYKYWSYEVKGGQLLYPFYFVKEVNKSNNQVIVKLKRLHRLQYGLPLWLIQNITFDNNYVLPNNYSQISEVTDNGGIYNFALQNLEQDFDANFEDYPEDINNEFFIKWYPESYSNALYETDTVIRLDVVQNGYYNQDTQNWTVQVWEDGNWYTDNSNRFGIVSYSNPDNNYNGYVIVKALQDNDTDELISSKLKITDNLGRSYERSFYQNFVTTDDDTILGDVNGDAIVNVLDIVQTVQIAIGLEDYQSEADLNGDGGVNVLDVVLLANIILDT